MTRASRWFGCLCLALVVGCGEDLFNDMNMQGDDTGDGDDASGGNGTGTIEGPRSGVDGDQSVADLSDADATKFCTWAAEKVSELVPTPEQVCTIYALSSGEPDQCVTDRDACLAQTEGMPVEQEDVDPAECTANVAVALDNGCDVTIAELEACFNDALAQVQAIFDQISCDSGGGLPTEQPEQPASCTLIEQKCPDFAVDSDEGSSADPGGDGDYPGDDYPSDPGDVPVDGTPDDGVPPDGEPEPEASCIDGTPIAVSQFCDGVVDCSQSEDEAYCDQAPAPRPSIQLVKKLPLFR